MLGETLRQWTKRYNIKRKAEKEVLGNPLRRMLLLDRKRGNQRIKNFRKKFLLKVYQKMKIHSNRNKLMKRKLSMTLNLIRNTRKRKKKRNIRNIRNIRRRNTKDKGEAMRVWKKEINLRVIKKMNQKKKRKKNSSKTTTSN